MNNINLPKHWKVARLGDVCNIVMGQSPPSTTYNDEGVGMPFLQGKAEFTELFPVPTKYCTKQLRVCSIESVLMSVRAPVGNVNLADREYIIGRGLTSISLKSGNNRFLFYLLLHNKKEFEAKSSGSTFKSINKTTINDFRISLPPLPEQRAIVHVLQTLQEAKFTRQREIALERERKAALMDILFSYGTKGEPRKQTEIGEIPESWEVVRLKKLCECLDSKRVPIKQSDRNERKGEVPYYGASGQIDWIDDYLFDEPLLLIAEDGENLVSRKLPIAYSIEGKSWVNNHAHVLRVNEINQFFLEYYFNSIDLSPYLTGATRPKLNKASLLDIPVPRPGYEEINEIALLFVNCDTKIAAFEKEVKHLDELFHAMLDELMTGQRSAVPLIDTKSTTFVK